MRIRLGRNHGSLVIIDEIASSIKKIREMRERGTETKHESRDGQEEINEDRQIRHLPNDKTKICEQMRIETFCHDLL
jgi:hypothetical protein